MHSPDSENPIKLNPAQSLLLELQSKTGTVLRDIAASLERGTVQDETDRGFIEGAVAFIENPTENLSDIMVHTTHIGEVLGGYDLQGTHPPPEIDAMHAYLLALQCINQMNFVEQELEQGTPDFSAIHSAMVRAYDWATILAKGYKDVTFLNAVNSLFERFNNS